MVTSNGHAAPLLPPVEDYILGPEAAELMRCSLPTFKRYYQHGFDGVKLRTVLIGGKRATTRQWIDDFIAARSDLAEYPVETSSDNVEAANEYLRAKGVL